MSNRSTIKEILKQLKTQFDIIAIKAEYEAEGSRFSELRMLRDLICGENIRFFVKIGGCEAIRDLDECRILDADGIIAPMTESPFAVKKFAEAVIKVYKPRERVGKEFIINTETIETYRNIDIILKKLPRTITGINVGIVDLTLSCGLTRGDVNTSKILDMASTFLTKGSAKALTLGFGGGLSMASIPFIEKMGNIAQRFETRKVVFDYKKTAHNIREALHLATEFEYLYLKFKQDFYKRISEEDSHRIRFLASRLKGT